MLVPKNGSEGKMSAFQPLNFNEVAANPNGDDDG
jgi:hypothetical protein